MLGSRLPTSTWYHVFAIIVNGAADVYFDTSITAANKPASTTAFRRIGSIKTDSNGHILAFTQTGGYFLWKQQVEDQNGVTPGTSGTSYALASVAPGVVVKAMLNVGFNSATANDQLLIYSLAQLPSSSGASYTTVPGAVVSANTSTPIFGAGYMEVLTNTSQQIGAQAGRSASTMWLFTIGYFDFRGQ